MQNIAGFITIEHVQLSDQVSACLTFLSDISIYVYCSKLVSYTHNNQQQQQKNTSLTLFAHHEPQGHLWNPYYQTVLLYV